jgi:uncharacterized protein (TIGR00661 family)
VARQPAGYAGGRAQAERGVVRILYGVPGEGMGHATRSRVILDHLSRSHQVKIVVSGRAHDYLKQHFPDVEEIRGLHLAYEGNAVDRSRTVYEIVRDAPDNLADNVLKYFAIARSFAPDCVVSDFESFAYFFGRRHRIPVVSIDNMQVINRCEHSSEVIPESELESFTLAKTIIKAKLPGCYHYLITTFFFPPVRKPRTSLYPPILRPEILAAGAHAAPGEHVLVYQTATTHTELLDVLAAVPNVPFRVYGFRRDETRGNVILRDFSEAGFVSDLASCRAVVAGGGFSLMGEAVYLGKPMLALPLAKQFEQSLNALYLAHLGYGECVSQVDSASIERFLARAPGYAERLRGHRQDGNTLILAALDQLLARIAAGEPPA